jgi:hypothetical protein
MHAKLEGVTFRKKGLSAQPQSISPNIILPQNDTNYFEGSNIYPQLFASFPSSKEVELETPSMKCDWTY